MAYDGFRTITFLFLLLHHYIKIEKDLLHIFLRNFK